MWTSDEDRPAVLHRLRSARGHLDAVIRMMENRADCEKVLSQLDAVQCALHAAGCRLVMEDVRDCAEKVRSGPSARDREQALEKLISLIEMKHLINDKVEN